MKMSLDNDKFSFEEFIEKVHFYLLLDVLFTENYLFFLRLPKINKKFICKTSINKYMYVTFYFFFQHKFLETLDFSKIYKEFSDENVDKEKSNKYCNDIKDELTFPDNYEELRLNFCNVLYKIILNHNSISDEFFEGIPKDVNLYYTSLKYWLYDKLLNLGPMGLKIDKILEKWIDKLEGKINISNPFHCTFNELDMSDMNKIRSVYTFLLIYYRNIDIFSRNENKYIECKYLDYIGKGLKEYHDSLKICSTNAKQSNYCKEFKELQEIYKENNMY